LVFFVERDDHIDVWRVLHGRRDIAARMQDSSVS
jgi:toxin ParE1/3/4